jgi:hypothetical protein
MINQEITHFDEISDYSLDKFNKPNYKTLILLMNKNLQEMTYSAQARTLANGGKIQGKKLN